MLIFNIVSENDKKKKRRLFFYQKDKNVKPERSSFVINNMVFNVVNISKEMLLNGELDKILPRFKGKILKTSDNDINIYLKDYLYNTDLYLKKSYLSQLKTVVKNEVSPSLCIYDDFFNFTQEICDVSSICKNITIYSKWCGEIQRYIDYCFFNYGLTVYLNESFALDSHTIYINLNNIYQDKAIFINIKGEESQLLPDVCYFTSNDDIKKLTYYGVPIKSACALLKDKST